MMTQAFKPSSRFFNLTYFGFMSFVLGSSLLGALACKPKAKAQATQPVSSSAQAPFSAAPSASVTPVRVVVPKGPAFAIEAGSGLGPVRFGATVATVERLMEAKCDELTDDYCRYIDAGVEYELSKGVVSGIVVARHGRPVAGSSGKTWGRTRCAIAPDVTPRVLLSYARSILGKPATSESVTTENPNHTLLKETYPGLVLEYDRGERTGDLILGSIRVTKSDKPIPAHKADPPPPVH